MGKRVCRSCGNVVPKKAQVCPHCSSDQFCSATSAGGTKDNSTMKAVLWGGLVGYLIHRSKTKSKAKNASEAGTGSIPPSQL